MDERQIRDVLQRMSGDNRGAEFDHWAERLIREYKSGSRPEPATEGTVVLDFLEVSNPDAPEQRQPDSDAAKRWRAFRKMALEMEELDTAARIDARETAASLRPPSGREKSAGNPLTFREVRTMGSDSLELQEQVADAVETAAGRILRKGQAVVFVAWLDDKFDTHTVVGDLCDGQPVTAPSLYMGKLHAMATLALTERMAEIEAPDYRAGLAAARFYNRAKFGAAQEALAAAILPFMAAAKQMDAKLDAEEMAELRRHRQQRENRN